MTSFFIYMDGAKDKLHAGPAWDYDLSFGNRWKLASARMWCYKSLMEDVDPNCQILHELMDIPEFRQLVCEIWNKQMKPVAAECISHLPASADEIRRAAFKDNEIWNGADFDFAVSSLTEWVSARADYLDNWFLECPEFEEGSYRLSINGRNVSVEGLARDDRRLLITRLPDGFYLLGNVEGTAFLTGGAAKDMLTGVIRLLVTANKAAKHQHRENNA